MKIKVDPIAASYLLQNHQARKVSRWNQLEDNRIVKSTVKIIYV